MVVANLANLEGTDWRRRPLVMRGVFRAALVGECVRKLPSRPGTGGQHEQKNSPETEEGGAHHREA